MIEALLYQVQVKMLSKTRVEITLVPTWLGRWFKRRVRKGLAYRARADDYEDEDGVIEGTIGWWWQATDRSVGWYVERYIEAAPMLAIEDMTVEQLLLDDPAEHERAREPRPDRSKKRRPAP